MSVHKIIRRSIFVTHNGERAGEIQLNTEGTDFMLHVRVINADDDDIIIGTVSLDQMKQVVESILEECK